MSGITRPSPLNNIVRKEGQPTTEMGLWIETVSDLIPSIGTGSPEGVVEARQTAQFMDDAGAPGAVLYIKQLADIGGDRSMGWVAIG